MSVDQALDRLKNAGRNDDCPCGSGKKYKKCHLRQDEEGASKALAESNATKAATAAHEHGPDCDHEGDMAKAPKPKPAMAAAPSGGGPKTPLSHKPMNVPRKAV